MQAGEIRTLTGLRGIAAVYVMVFHYFAIGMPLENPAYSILAHGYLAVDLFFVLSGFVMGLNYSFLFTANWNYASYKIFIGRRFARIYPLYIFLTLVAAILVAYGFLPWESDQGSKWVLILCNILMIQCWGIGDSFDLPAWSISAEWSAYIVFPVLLIPTLRRSYTTAWLTYIICIAIIAALCALPLSIRYFFNPSHMLVAAALLDFSDPRFALPIARCITEFTIGLLSFRFYLSNRFLFTRSSKFSLLILLLLIFLLAVPKSDLFIVILLPVALASFSNQTTLVGTFLSSRTALLLGRLSYSIYLTHDLMGGLIAWVHRLVNSAGLSHGQTYGGLIGVAVTFPCAFGLYKWVEIPGRRYLRFLFEGSRRADPISAEPSAP